MVSGQGAEDGTADDWMIRMDGIDYWSFSGYSFRCHSVVIRL